jgi:capsular polysaccharide biosynthesis protein
MAHPRNPSGYTARRIANEEEVWRSVKEADTDAVVNGVQLDRLSMIEQLELVSDTDILIGMHGAGLSHIIYLPQTSGVIELYPNYMSVSNAHFRAMSKWRRLRHMVWSNQDKSLESKDHQTHIPNFVIKDLVKAMKKSIC